MNGEPELDAYLMRQLDEPPIPDNGFTETVSGRVARRVRRRRLTLTAVAVATGGLTAGTAWTGLAAVAAPSLTTAEVLALLVLAAACGVVWIDTASRLPVNSQPAG